MYHVKQAYQLNNNILNYQQKKHNTAYFITSFIYVVFCICSPLLDIQGEHFNLHLQNASRLNNQNLQGRDAPKNQNIYNIEVEYNNDEHGKRYAQLC